MSKKASTADDYDVLIPLLNGSFLNFDGSLKASFAADDHVIHDHCGCVIYSCRRSQVAVYFNPILLN